MDNNEKYWVGKKNFVARQWYYILQGLDLVNQFKYLGAFIFGIYYTFKLPNPWFLIILFAISLPLLLIAGFIKAWHFNKVVDWLTTELGTHWTRYGYELQEKQIKLLEEILKKK